MKTAIKQKADLRFRPKSDYLNSASWEDLYVIGEHWLSDMEYYNDELRFLNNLIGKFYISISELEIQPKVNEMGNRLLMLNKEHTKIVDRIKKNQLDLSLLMENAFSHEEQFFRDEHIKLEDDTLSFLRKFREVKQMVFSITEKILEARRIKRIVNE